MSNVERIMSLEEKKAIETLLFQIADDDFLFSYRGSEWLGLAPHIEEDVASSSITQDSMGHAAMYYKLLEDLGLGEADDLAHLRTAEDRKNSVLTERVNGDGYYMDTPQYDWAYTVVRSYFYTQAKRAKINSLKESSYEPLREIAVKVSMELYYHVMHWKLWFEQLLSSTEEAKTKMISAIELVVEDIGDLFSYGEQKELIESFDLIDSEEKIQSDWLKALRPTFEKQKLDLPIIPEPKLNGRDGQHTDELQAAIDTLSEVYRLDTATNW